MDAFIPSGDHRLMAPHDLLLHVCVHFVDARRVRSEGALAQIRDIAWLAAKSDVDWAQLLDVSRRFGVAGRVRLALAVTEELGLLAPVAVLPALTRREAAYTKRFAATRVLTDRAVVPLGNWRANRAGLDGFLWWSRTHLSDVSAAELPDDDAARVATMIDNRTALLRGARALVAAPLIPLRDLRVGPRLRTLQ